MVFENFSHLRFVYFDFWLTFFIELIDLLHHTMLRI